MSTFGHPLQYALCARVYVGDTENMSDEDVRRAAAVERTGLPVERYNRCPTCEQWSPCDARKAEAGQDQQSAGSS